MQTHPEYLRLHTEDDATPFFLLPDHQSISKKLTQATGWEIHFRPTHPDQANSKKPRQGTFEVVDLAEHVDENHRPIFREAADRIALVANELVSEVEKSKIRIRELNADLATHVPVVHRTDATQRLELLESLLESAAAVAGCSRAGLCLLDDASAMLQTRATIGCDISSFDSASRPLERSVADIEAIVGHAVVIEDVSLLPHWKVPVECQSAICIPVSSMTTPLGTLWIFGDEIRDYDSETINMIEIIAGRIASELQFDAIVNEVQANRKNVSTAMPASGLPASKLTKRRRPMAMPPVDEIKTHLTLPEGNANPFVADWSFHQDGRLWLFAADCDSAGPIGHEIANAMQTAFCSLRNFACSPKEMIDAVVDTVCRLEPAAVEARIQCGLVDLEHESVEKASIEMGPEFWLGEKEIREDEFSASDLSETDASQIQLDGAGWQIEWRNRKPSAK